MKHLSQLLRDSKEISIRHKFHDLSEPECYIAENIDDYKSSITEIKSPWFKKYSPVNLCGYAEIMFYNIGITGILLDGKLINGFVQIHDSSGEKIAAWSKPGEYLGNEKSYSEMINNKELEINDWVYRITIAHHYETPVSFITLVQKHKPNVIAKNKLSFLEKLALDNFEPCAEF